MDKVVPVELAKKLKASGFHEPCAHCYIWEQGTDWSFDLYLEFISAPTFVEVLEWLNREKGFNPEFKYSELENIVTNYINNNL